MRTLLFIQNENNSARFPLAPFLCEEVLNLCFLSVGVWEREESLFQFGFKTHPFEKTSPEAPVITSEIWSQSAWQKFIIV